MKKEEEVKRKGFAKYPYADKLVRCPRDNVPFHGEVIKDDFDYMEVQGKCPYCGTFWTFGGVKQV